MSPRVVAITIARNSEWVLEATLRTALRYCDGCAVLDHASTDRTPSILAALAAEFPGRVRSVREDDPTWHEMDHRQRVLDLGREMGGAVFANVDDDELLTFNLHDAAREMLAALRPGEALISPIMCVWDGLERVRDDDSEWTGGTTYLGFADCPGMTFKPASDGYQFHNRRPAGNGGALVYVAQPREWRTSGGVLHLQFASRRRLLAKQALYQMTEVTRWPGRKRPEDIAKLYANTAVNFPRGYHPMPDGWLPPEVRQQVAIDAPPWQEAEAQRLWREHGAEKFAGLNLFGVVG